METNKKLICKVDLKSGLNAIIPFLGFAVIFIAFQIICDNGILNDRSLKSIMNSAFQLMVGGVGVLFVMAQGNIDMSVGGVTGLAAAIGAIAGETNLALVIPFALLTGCVCGMFTGFLVSKLRVPAFVATIGMSFLTRGLLTFILASGTAAVPRHFNFETWYVKFGFLLVFLIAGFILFEFSIFGKHSRAIGSAREAAAQAGVAVNCMCIAAYMFSGFVAGVNAIFMLSRTNTASAVSGMNLEFQILLAVMVGGFSMGGGWVVKYRNIIIGAFTASVLSVGLVSSGLISHMQQLVQGIVLIIAVVLSYSRETVAVIK